MSEPNYEKCYIPKWGQIEDISFLSPKLEIHDNGHGLNGIFIQPTTIHWPKYLCTYAYVVIFLWFYASLLQNCLLEIKDSWFLVADSVTW